MMKERVKQLCKERGKSLKVLATEMNIAPESLSRTLNGNPTLSTMQNIAEALNVPVSELLAPEPDGNVYGILVINNKPNRIKSIEDLEQLVQLSKIGKS